MTEPWIAFPPEVHSAMLNYGAGVGPMLISATQNGELSAQYAEAASEVEELLGVVASEGWQGQAAEAFVAAYMPFLAWLIQASADCVEMAAQQHVVIEAYTAAVELMPTQVELAANQIKLAVLVATNFFGINTIPIAINEAEYVEMWVRAATTMATYSTVSRSALSAMPHTSPPPLILKSDELLPDTGEDSDEDGHNHGGHSHGGHARMIDNFFAEILRGVSAGRIVWDPVNGTLNGLDYDDYVYPGHAIWWLARGLEFFQDGEQFGELLFTNPTGAFQFLLYVVVVDLPTHIAQIATWLGQYPQLLSAALTGVIAHLGAITGLAGLSGLSAIPSAAMQGYITRATQLSPEHPVLVDRFLEDAVEIDVDALCDGAEVYIGGIMEHIEEAGIHSGDSACALPPVTLGRSDIEKVRKATEAIAHGIGVVGLLNVQYALKDDVLYVLEANPRASRTVPFVSKATAVPLAKACARIMLGATIAQLRAEGLLAVTGDGAHAARNAPIAVKEAVLPFHRFRRADGAAIDSLLGPEMKSTGEVMGIDRDFGSAFAKSQTAAYGSLPAQGTVFVSVANRDKRSLVFPVKRLADLGFRVLATEGTAEMLRRNGIPCDDVRKHFEPAQPGRPTMSAVDAIRAGEVNMVINTPYGNSGPRIDGYEIRSAAVAGNIPCITTVQGASAAVQGIEAGIRGDIGVRSLQELHRVIGGVER